ncbi:MAG: twin-arginine translocase TatA/TatE family subunit [Rhodospirillales bacterium]|nr:twin-arginine translocase TatA/TatE family subunit [Rhodospirillales bacterium]
MMNFSLVELLLIVAVAVLVIGPKEIPGLLYGLGRIVRRLQYIRYAFSRQFDDFMKLHDLDDLRRGVNFEEKPVDKNGEVVQEKKPADSARDDNHD